VKPPEAPGLYALIIEVPSTIGAKIGSLGVKRFTAGCYVYLGSAKGPGGLAARISRHVSREKKLRWHIDYLLTSGASVHAVVYAEEHVRPECILTPLLEELGFTHPVEGFGSSDCRRGCRSHLLKCPCGGCSRCLEEVVEAFKKADLEPRVLQIARK